MKFCTNCGSQMPDESVFCPECGTASNASPRVGNSEVDYEATTILGETPEPQPEFPQAPAAPPYEAPQPEVPQAPAAPQYEAPQPEFPHAPAAPQYEAPQPEFPHAPAAPSYEAPQPEVPQAPAAPQYEAQQGQPVYYQPQQQQQQYYQLPQQNQQQYYQPQQQSFTPQQMPQIPFNDFGAQPMEEKANVGLAILSFIIPIVGLVLFLTKKKTQPKTAKACGLAALISAVLGIILGVILGVIGAKFADDYYDDYDFDSYSYSDDYNEDGGYIFIDSEEIYGTFSGTTYTNRFFNVKYELPAGYYFDSYEDIMSDDLDYSTSDGIDVPHVSSSNGTIYYDSTMRNDDTYSTVYTAETADMFSYPDEMLDYFADDYEDDEDIVDRSGYYDMYVAGNSFTCCDITYDVNGVKMYSSYFVTEKNDVLFLVNFITTEYSDLSPAAYFEAYFSTVD